MAIRSTAVALFMASGAIGTAWPSAAGACRIMQHHPGPSYVQPTPEEAARRVAETIATKTRRMMEILGKGDTVFVGIAERTEEGEGDARKTRFRIVERIAGRLWGRFATIHWTEYVMDDGCESHWNGYQMQMTYLIVTSKGRPILGRPLDNPDLPELFTFEAAVDVARKAAKAGLVGESKNKNGTSR
ncbi:hypothetical protein [Tahibacter amnicola]|uniref:CNP1-like family protein n=1 Tax=Tahibacter amnicola TaxID=2976241 RepID=A0ABY6B8P2_9GAMM|nr:hypothetical protein [Tahibacter amnicola]UXI65881.1 hypothetical protein N4264_14050 [Tahibacter amnicola]